MTQLRLSGALDRGNERSSALTMSSAASTLGRKDRPATRYEQDPCPPPRSLPAPESPNRVDALNAGMSELRYICVKCKHPQILNLDHVRPPRSLVGCTTLVDWQ